MATNRQTEQLTPRLEHGRDGRLWATWRGRTAPVRVVRCFPWSSPGEFVSLRDEHKREFCLVEDMTRLDSVSRAALEQALLEADFVLEIESIVAIREEIEIRSWTVETRQGRRRFQTRRDDWPRDVPGGGLLIRDIAGDLFLIRDPGRLEPDSRELLSAFVD